MKTTIVTALALVALAAAASASPCGQRIAALEQRAGAPADGQGTAPETTDAKRHRQPTAGSVERAESSADSPDSVRTARFQVYIEQARAADASHDAEECEASANEAEKALR